MAQYVVVQADPLPVLDGEPSNAAVYRVTALSADLAAIAVATASKSSVPIVVQVASAGSVSRYTVTPTPPVYAAVLG